MADAQGAIDWLCNPEAEVSAHYVICKTGTVTRLVPEAERAWHAGAGAWGAVTDVNSRSIGIELDNDGSAPFSEPLMASLETVLPQIMKRWSVPPERVIAHSDCAPGRKIDPGAKFDWQRLVRAGMAIWPNARAAQPTLHPDQTEHLLACVGYTGNVPLAAKITAFRLRIGSHQTGPLTLPELTALQDWATRWPVDATAPLA